MPRAHSVSGTPTIALACKQLFAAGSGSANAARIVADAIVGSAPGHARFDRQLERVGHQVTIQPLPEAADADAPPTLEAIFDSKADSNIKLD